MLDGLGQCERLQQEIVVAVYCRESALNGPFELGYSAMVESATSLISSSHLRIGGAKKLL